MSVSIKVAEVVRMIQICKLLVQIPITMSLNSLNTNYSIVTMFSGPNVNKSRDPIDEPNAWIIYSGGIISGVVLLELILVLLVVICRKYQIRRKERAEQEHVYYVKRGERRSTFDFTGNFASRATYKDSIASEVEPQSRSNIAYNVVTASNIASEVEPQSRSNIAYNVVTASNIASEVEPQSRSNIAYNVVSVPSSRPSAAHCDDHTSRELETLEGDKVTAKEQAKETQSKQKEYPNIVVTGPVLVGPNSSHEVSPPASDESTTGDQNASTLSGEIPPLQMKSRKIRVAGISSSVNQPQLDQESEMEHAYEVLDELQKQIHILSQSIPMLDVFGNEVAPGPSKIKPAAPKISRSIPTLLDMAGYEDLDAVRPNQAQAFPKVKRKPAQVQSGIDFGTDFCANKTSEECPQLVPPHTTESLYTAAQKKQSITRAGIGEKTKPGEPVYSVVQKKMKAFSVSDLTEDPPPVPPMTAEALYTAVQKPKKTSTRYYSAIITNESLPQSATLYDNEEEIPPIKAPLSMDIYKQSKEEASKSGGQTQVQLNQEGHSLSLHMYPTTVEGSCPSTYIYDDELQTDL